ncbi:unnamed protein product, partial [Discosporangium mesarthrocarpum]
GEPGTYLVDKDRTDVFEEVESLNEHSKVLTAVHETFLQVRYNDPTLSKSSAAVDWLLYADLMEARTGISQDYAFQRYRPLAAAGVHHLCQSDQRTAVGLPKKDFEARTAQATKYNILQSFNEGRHLTATGRTCQAAVLDMLSHIMDILAPPLRPLNLDLLNGEERVRFRGLVDVLLSCGLNFATRGLAHSGVGPSGIAVPGATPEYVLEPAIDQLVTYAGFDLCHNSLPSTVKQMVSHEVHLESMRRSETVRLESALGSSALSGDKGEKRGMKRPSLAGTGASAGPDSEAGSMGGSIQADQGAASAGVRQAGARAMEIVNSRRTEQAGVVGEGGPGVDFPPKKKVARESTPATVPFWNHTNRMR